jgi:hypothetical protein
MIYLTQSPERTGALRDAADEEKREGNFFNFFRSNPLKSPESEK